MTIKRNIMSKRLGWYYTLVFVVTLSVILSGAINWIFQFTFTSVVFFLSAVFITKKVTNKLIVYLVFLILPFSTIYGYGLVFRSDISLSLMPIVLTPSFCVIFGTLISNKYYVILYIILSIIFGYIGMSNWLTYTFDNENPINKSFPKISLNDINDINFTFDKNKIIILDLWSSSCGVCIKEFPEFEKLSNRYKDNPNASFYTLNLPLKRDSTINLKSYVKDYKFNSLFTEDLDSWKKLENNTVPKLLILDKSLNIVYKGTLNDKWYLFYNNIDNLIKKHVKE